MISNAGLMGGKTILQNLHSLAANRADLRRETSAWAMICWVYADEKAHIATNADSGGLPGPRLAMSRLEGGKVGGLINARLDAHDDAVLLDAMAVEWFGWPGRDRLVAYAERRIAPPAAITVLRLRIVPKLDDGGRMVMVYPPRGRHEAIACVLDYEGEPAEKAAAREREWSDWHRLLVAFEDVLAGRRFKKWKIVPRGS